jgi:hypothetical protein
VTLIKIRRLASFPSQGLNSSLIKKLQGDMSVRKRTIFSIVALSGLTISSAPWAKESGFSGSWEYVEHVNGSSKPFLVFEIRLKETTNGFVTGSYCSITQSGSRIDCSTDDTENISGHISESGRNAEVNFYSFFGAKDGAAILGRDRSVLTWRVTRNPTGGFFYGPFSATLSRRQINGHQGERQVVADKAYLYSEPSEARVSTYVVKGDYVKILEISSNLKFWNISYTKKNGTEINRWIDCRAIDFCP